jgi:hypothetical protein
MSLRTPSKHLLGQGPSAAMIKRDLVAPLESVSSDVAIDPPRSAPALVQIAQPNDLGADRQRRPWVESSLGLVARLPER